MSRGKLAAALLVIWIVSGLAFEVVLHIDRTIIRATARAAAPRLIAERNLAKAIRFVDGCLRREITPIDDLLYDCHDVKLLHLPARMLREEMNALEHVATEG